MDEALVLDNLGLARMVAHRYMNTGIEFDDLEQTARIGLVKAARKYDPERGVKFSAFAVPVMNNEINLVLRGMRKCVSAVSLETEIIPGEDLTIADILPAKEDAESVIMAKDVLETALGWLLQIPEKKRDIVIRRVLLQEKQAVIASQCGCSRVHVSRVVKSELTKLKRILSEGGDFMEKFEIGEKPVEIVPGVWLSFVDGVLHVEKHR